MKKIGVITFHATYNYGSNLQAFALQEYVKKICNNDCEYKIINLRTPIQYDMYKSLYEEKNLKGIIKQIILLPYRKALLQKQENFEKFINMRLSVTKEYSTKEELEQENFNFDYYISGSDQLWNLRAKDFDWSFFLEFVKKGKKISYAASFGPKSQEWNDVQKARVSNDLKKYTNISVREEGSYKNVNELTGIKPEINVDPTMLLTKEEWKKIIPKEQLEKQKYILYYDLHGKGENDKIVKEISKQLELPVIITKYMGINTHFTKFKKRYDCGPIEFLELINNASLVVSSSFHGNVFSIIFNKPFFAINGLKDFRIKTLLEKMKLTDRAIDIENISEKCKNAYDIDFENANKELEKERKKSEEYLKKALDIK